MYPAPTPMLSDANVMSARWKLADPRALLFSVLLVVVASAASVRTLPAMLGLFVFVVIWYAAAARRPAGVFTVLRRILPFAAVIVALNALLVPGDALVRIAGHR